ncbi:uncharacterized protein [Ptychodera flava]|uniref:uncharacterized protein n=1 Tax=Ptychodera flava TaxID=63121 RepID=UPI00396A4A0C
MIRRILLTLCFSLICIYLYTLFDANQFSAQFDVLHILYHKSNVSAVSTVSSKTHLDATHHHGRHLLGHEDVVEEIPKPELSYTIDGEDFPNDIDGGSVLTYNVHLTHSVEREHTQCVVVFRVDIPFSTFSNDTLKVNFSSDLMKDSPDDNITMIPLNGTVEHLTSLDQVRFTFNISLLMWINLTEPWKRPDCWWTPSKECYQTDYLDCIFFDASPQQNWDPAYCYRIDIYDCLPANASSECFFLDTMQCIERLNSTTEDISTLLCPKVKETNCIQINDRGLYFTDYNWTQPTLPPPKIPDNIVVEMCDMTSSEIWRETRRVNGTWFETSLFITPTDENGCRLIEMSPMEETTGPPPTIDPYMGLPTTDEYKIAKECLNINTTGFYHPYIPTIWKKFDIALSFSGMIINTVEVNQKFNAEVNADITQITKKPADQLTQASASVEYKVKKPGTTVTATQTFSENKNALKHEQIDYKVVLKVSECQNGGISLTITCKEINEEQKMNITTPEDDIVVVIGKNLIATTKINETYPGPVPLINLTTVISEKEPPRFELRKVQTKTDQLEPIFDEIVVEFSPFINLYDDENNLYDRVRIEFSLRTLTNVEPDDVLDVSAKAEYLESPEGGFTGSHSSKLTVTEQPTVPDIPPAKSYIDPDALDDIVYNFTLRHTLEHTLYDIWMEVTCPDLVTLNGTRNLEFIYIGIQPNTTEEVEHTSAWDEKFTLGPKYFIHLVELTPEVVFKGQQTFHIWDNSMKPHQQFWCYIELSYRKEWDKPIVLPYIAGYSPSLTFPQPTYELYGRDIQVNMTQYTMPVGSNATYIMNITFPELTTQMTVSINLPPAVLMLWYALISHHGTNLQLNNSTNTYLGTTEEDIGKWNTSIRTNMLMNFGTVINHADNVATFDGDNLMVEFNVVLLDAPETVVKDAEFSLSTTVSYTNGEDMVQQQTIKVLEPGVTMKLYITNSSTTGDPGDVFQYKVTLTHTEESQSPAHHVLIDIHLQYMEVYADFLPNNQSRAPETQVFHEVGPLKADEIFQLYLYKLELGEIIEGTFLAQVSTKLTTGIALLATAEVDIYSFYQWGRLYEISLASLNVVNIRNATLEFIGTSEPATLDRNVLVHEQATFKYRIPLPPIPTELIVSVRLPKFETTRKKWLLDYLRSSVPDPLPTESVFIEQGCLGTENLLTEDCHCYHSNNLNFTLNLTQIMTAYTCEELQTTAGCSISMAMTWPPLSGYSNAGNDTVSGGAENRTSNFSSDNPPTSPTNINTTNQSVGKKTSEDCPFWYYICYKTTIASCEATRLASNLTSLSARNDSTCTNSNDTSVNQTQTENCTETNEVSCQMVALQVCDTMLYRKCSRHNETLIDSAICLCPMKATTESPNVVTEVSQDRQRIVDTYNLCVNRTDTTTETATTAGRSGIAGTDAATGGNGTAPPAMQMTGGPVDDGVDECDFEENVMFGMAAVVHTSMTSTRPGVVCSFKGGNLHDPISPGVIYHSPIVPTKRFRAGDEVSVIVTMLILDEPEVVRGSFLEANFTSTFIYETIPVPPPPMFQENCTCHENEFSTTDLSLSDCRCPSIKLYNATEMDCNCTEIIEAHMIIIQGFGCDCINLCHQRHDYFNAFGKEEQISNLTSLCDCASLNTALNSAGNRQLREHVQECLLVHFNWYTCYSLPYIKDIDVEVCVDVNELSCQAIPVIPCTCQQATEPNQYECACRNTSSSSENSDSVIQWNATTGLSHGILHQSSCLCENSEGWPRQCNCTTDNTAIMDGQRCVNEIKPNCSMVKKAVEGVEAETNCSCSRLNRDVAYNATVLLNNTDETNSSSATPSGEMSQEVTVTKYRKMYYLNCSCPDVGQDFDELEDLRCKSLPKTYQATDCSCFVPLDNVTQSILDNWDYNATVKDIAETSMADHVVVVEPELEISFTRQPEPEVVDRLDEVKFDFNVKHTGNSNGPAYNLTVTLYAVNFTRITGTGALTPQAVVTGELCSEPSHCNVTYNNHLGIFYLNFLPVDPPDSAFSGTFTLIVKNHIDFVANSLITAAAILKYDSCSVDFPGRKYGPISDDDTVKIDAPVLSSSLHKSTAYIYHIEEISGPLPKTFSIGDIMVVQAELFVPEITLHMVNLSIESPLQDYIVNYGDAFLTKKISVRNDTESFFLESAGHEGEVYPPSPYDTAEFRKGGFAIGGGVLVSDANNTVTDNDYVTIRFAFRINDVEYWQDDTEIPFTMTSVYVSDYISELITLTDAELMLTVVEPKLSLRAEVLDHSWQLEQVTATSSSYTCEVNTCCQDESCEEARICITATDTMTECGTKECRCYSGYFENERDTCTAVGRIAGDIIQYGLTVTHDPEFTGNAFDVLVRLHSDLESDLLEGAHFFSRKMTDFSIMSLLSFPSLLQTSDNDFEVKIQRFNHPDACERFKIPFRIRPEIESYPAMEWSSKVCN